MATETNEPRALTAALSGPAFTTRAGGVAMHVADRHVERWAPEAGAHRVRSLQSLGFVDRLVAPWIETAQRSAALRMFSQYVSNGAGKREGAAVSWVFPRPWYQDELDWMAAARQTQSQDQRSEFLAASSQVAAPTVLTTRGTYVAPASSQLALPAALYEYVAPSLSVARPEAAQGMTHDTYSSLVPVAASQAAQMMSRATAPLFGGETAAARMSPGLRAVLTTMIQRTQAATPTPTRVSSIAPELVTPPAPRLAEIASGSSTEQLATQPAAQQAMELAERYAEQHLQIAELQRVARVVAAREQAARVQQAQPTTQRQEVVTTEQRIERAAEPMSGERVRLEQRIRERIAERATQTQRLHEQSREAAARDARQAPVVEATTPLIEAIAPSVPSVREPVRVPAEIAVAMAALPPELTRYIGQRPERAIQAIGELNEALRTIELLARNAASGGSVEPTRGPRLVMPAGLGGLVSTIDRAPQMMHFATPQVAVAQPPRTPQAMRVPAMAWLSQGATGSIQAPTSALGATAASSPAAIQHVAWADRWLARFAGARSQSLDVLSASAARPASRLTALAAAAPDGVFVAPTFDLDRTELPRAIGDRDGDRTTMAIPQSVRIDDAAETPDDVFVAISAAASRSRATTIAAAQPPPPAAAPIALRDTYADFVAHSAPTAPTAGLSAQLASSPFAAALRHVMPLGAAPTFDVRALFAENLSASFLSGLLAPSTHEIAIAAQLPMSSGWSERSIAMPIGMPSERSSAMPSGMPSAASEAVLEGEREVADWQATYVAPELAARAGVGEPEISEPSEQAARAAALAPLLTLRSALLSWDVETQATAHAAATSEAPAAAAFGSARAMIEAMSLPMLGELAAVRESEAQVAWTSPGMTADRAHSWSVAQERSTADLAFDFVTPELLLAARVYGLGPTEAAQAARLAIAGAGNLTAMAGTVDRTFVQALAIHAQQREAVAEHNRTPLAATGELAVTDDRAPSARPVASFGSPITAYPTTTSSASGTTFGVERRAPRGAFLWPAATVGALGLNAASPDGQQSMSVAALELLAAQAVAELGTYAAFTGGEPLAGRIAGTSTSRGLDGSPTGSGVADLSSPDPIEAIESDVLASAASLVPMARRSKFEAMYIALGQTPTGRNYSPAARAARALALAGRGEETMSARERAAIAWDVMPQLFVAPAEGQDEHGQPLSTGAVAQRSLDRATQRRMGGSAGDYAMVESRPGLAALSARAGEALGSYTAPAAAPALATESASAHREVGAVLRAPTAAQELVRTGRPSGRHGGGEVEIPTWFENAARKMFEDRSGGTASDISLAELTLVQAAPPSQVAASTRGVPSATPAAPSAAPGGKGGGQKIDVEKIANDVYQQILVLMDAARARNGEPYL